MIKLTPIKVSAHSGYKAGEYPRSFMLDEKEFYVDEITDRWYQSDNIPGYPKADYFRVSAESSQYLLKHELDSDNWYLCE